MRQSPLIILCLTYIGICLARGSVEIEADKVEKRELTDTIVFRTPGPTSHPTEVVTFASNNDDFFPPWFTFPPVVTQFFPTPYPTQFPTHSPTHSPTKSPSEILEFITSPPSPEGTDPREGPIFTDPPTDTEIDTEPEVTILTKSNSLYTVLIGMLSALTVVSLLAVAYSRRIRVE